MFRSTILLQRTLVLGLIWMVPLCISAQPAAYKFAFIERLATEKWGGSRDMSVTTDGSIYVIGTTTTTDLPVVGTPIVDVKTLKPEASGLSYIQKYDAEGNLAYASYINACAA